MPFANVLLCLPLLPQHYYIHYTLHSLIELLRGRRHILFHYFIFKAAPFNVGFVTFVALSTCNLAGVLFELRFVSNLHRREAVLVNTLTNELQ